MTLHLAHLSPQDWEGRGLRRTIAGHEIFTIDLPARGDELLEPLLVIHGYPTSSYDFVDVVDGLNEHRRVVLLDLLGYGLSDKPDLAYTLAAQADIVVEVTAQLELDRLSLLTHDMGDTVGGELLARHLEGSWPVEIVRRFVTNGSIYIEMAHLTAGQQFLLSLPDEILPAELAPDRVGLAGALTATLAPTNQASVDTQAHADLIVAGGGNRLLARIIRYIEERRLHERRYTGAIESHPSPLHIIWGSEDPIAIAAMAVKLHEARPDSTLTWIEGTGHYPQLEAPGPFVDAVAAALTTTP